MGIMCPPVEAGQASWICEKEDHSRKTLYVSLIVDP